MRKVLIILLGIGLILGGVGYSVWWGKVEAQSRAFAAEEMPTPDILESKYLLFDQALTVLGMDIKSPAATGDPAEIFSRFVRAVGIRITLGVIVTVAGVVVVVVTFRRKGDRTLSRE